MRFLKARAGVVILVLVLTPGLAAAQSKPASESSASRGLPLEQYTASLGIATPTGEMRKATPRWSWSARVATTREDQNRAALTSPRQSSSATAVQCPMPIVRPDTTVSRPLPMVLMPRHAADSTAEVGPPVGVIRGCENPLASTR